MTDDPDGLRIGALARMSDVAAHPEVTAGYPVLAESLLLAASPQLRNMAMQDSAQGIFVVQAALAAAFGLPADHVHVSCPFVGGGFGCKGFVHPHQLLTAAAARVLGRPVQLVLPRGQMFTGCGHQPATRQSVALGAAREGRLTAAEHDSVNAAARADDYAEFGELGAVGVSAAIANAVFHATGIRVRDLPIRIHHLL